MPRSRLTTAAGTDALSIICVYIHRTFLTFFTFEGLSMRSPLQMFAESILQRAAVAAAQATSGGGLTSTDMYISRAASSHGGTETEFSSCQKFRSSFPLSCAFI